MVCYYTNWASDRRSPGKFLPEDIDGQLCTHIVYAFATLEQDTFHLHIGDSVDIFSRFLNKLAELKRRFGTKVLLGLGGWNDSGDDKYSRLATSGQPTRKGFAAYITRILEQYGFDGLDLDWEYPVCWQVNRNIFPSFQCNYNNSFNMKYQKYFETFKEDILILIRKKKIFNVEQEFFFK